METGNCNVLPIQLYTCIQTTCLRQILAPCKWLLVLLLSMFRILLGSFVMPLTNSGFHYVTMTVSVSYSSFKHLPTLMLHMSLKTSTMLPWQWVLPTELYTLTYSNAAHELESLYNSTTQSLYQRHIMSRIFHTTSVFDQFHNSIEVWQCMNTHIQQWQPGRPQ